MGDIIATERVGMAIFVVCPGCRTRFTVSDKFAGKSGPCPKCKTTIQIPKLEEQVVIHEPEMFGGGGRTTTGELVLKPIARVERRVTPVMVLSVVGAIVVVLVGTLVLGSVGVFKGQVWLQAIGLALVTLPTSAGAYEFLRHQEDLQPLRGRRLWARAAACTLGYLLVWWAFNRAVATFVTEELWTWAIVLPPAFALGAFVAFLAFEIEYTSGLLHFTLFALIAVILRWAAGLGWMWALPAPAHPYPV